MIILILKLITDSRKFWKQVTPFFSDKTHNHCNIALLEGTVIIKDNNACAELLNHFFSDAVKTLGIDRGSACKCFKYYKKSYRKSY